MKNLLRAAAAASVLLFAHDASAAPRTATLLIENVSCVACAPIVRSVLSRVSGVSRVAVVERRGMATATVAFDDEQVTAQALAQATTNAGYPTTIVTGERATLSPMSAATTDAAAPSALSRWLKRFGLRA